MKLKKKKQREMKPIYFILYLNFPQINIIYENSISVSHGPQKMI